MRTYENIGNRLKVASVILGTLLGGFLWRCRGESGFGSSWGLYSVGLVLVLLIYNFYGRRNGMKFEKILIGSLMTGLGVTGYATVLQQMSGLLESDLPYQGECISVAIDPYSGMKIILLMGFTLVPLFSFFVGTLFARKEVKLHHYAIAFALYLAVQTICKATIAPYILNAINPDQVKWAALGLADSGYDYTSPMAAYMDHFLDRAWTQEIPFFENYYMSIEHISDAIAALFVSFYPLVVLKDKIPTIISLVINTYTAIATTILTSLLIVEYDTGLLANVKAPSFLHYGSGWGLWEFSTGASVGFITMLVIAILPKKRTAQNVTDIEPAYRNKGINFTLNMLLSIFILALTPWRAIGIRVAKLLVNFDILKDDSPTGDIIMIAGTVAFGVWFIIMIAKNIFKKNTTPMGVDPLRFSRIALPAYVGMCAVLYFFCNHGYAFLLPFSEMTSVSRFFDIMLSSNWMEFTWMVVALVVSCAVYFPARKSLGKIVTRL